MAKKEEYKIDINNIFLQGYSVGGGLVALLSMHAHKKNIPIRASILAGPLCDVSQTTKDLPEVQEYKKAEEKDLKCP